MQNATSFLLSDVTAGVGADDVPAFCRIRQDFARPVIADLDGAIAAALEPAMRNVQAGQSIAITGSSRGISNFSKVVAAAVEAARAKGAEPFVIPGMGSHGGATAEGQIEVLADTHGITEAAVGCPIRSSMEVVQVGTTDTGFPVFQDRNCMEADGVLVINRVKPHTGFTEKVESGLCKMLVIGMGKQAGASRIHQQALRIAMGRMVLDASRIILEAERPRLLGGIALVENAFKETAEVEYVPMTSHAELVAREAALLVKAYEYLPRLPFEELDGLLIDEMGKNISGSGMDTNVIGKKPGQTSPRIGAIYIRGLTEETHGNAVGIGNADLMPQRMFDKLDLNSTYMNAFTAKSLRGGKIPMVVQDELQAMQVLLNFRQEENPASARLAWIKNTSKVDEMWISEALLDEARANSRLEIVSDPTRPTFDAENSLTI